MPHPYPPERRNMPAAQQPRGINWCFTLNNYTEEDVVRMERLVYTHPEDIKYVIFGKEVGEQNGTPHLQGFIAFDSRRRLNQVIAMIGQMHLSVTRRVANAIEYCKKEGDWVEFGTAPKAPKRTDLDILMADINDGQRHLPTLMRDHPMVCARYRSFVVEYLHQTRPRRTLPSYELKSWQRELNIELNRPPNDRDIVFVVDIKGNGGKTWFAHHYKSLHPETVQIIPPGKKLDMAHFLGENNRVLFFDCPRSKQGDYLQYDFLEEVKNGYVFSGKYSSTDKEFDPPHVVVFMNEHPDMSKLSIDRYKIVVIN